MNEVNLPPVSDPNPLIELGPDLLRGGTLYPSCLLMTIPSSYCNKDSVRFKISPYLTKDLILELPSILSKLKEFTLEIGNDNNVKVNLPNTPQPVILSPGTYTFEKRKISGGVSCVDISHLDLDEVYQVTVNDRSVPVSCEDDLMHFLAFSVFSDDHIEVYGYDSEGGAVLHGIDIEPVWGWGFKEEHLDQGELNWGDNPFASVEHEKALEVGELVAVGIDFGGVDHLVVMNNEEWSLPNSDYVEEPNTGRKLDSVSMVPVESHVDFSKTKIWE